MSGAVDERPPLANVLQAATLNPLKEVVFAATEYFNEGGLDEITNAVRANGFYIGA